MKFGDSYLVLKVAFWGLIGWVRLGFGFVSDKIVVLVLFGFDGVRRIRYVGEERFCGGS